MRENYEDQLAELCMACERVKVTGIAKWSLLKAFLSRLSTADDSDDTDLSPFMNLCVSKVDSVRSEALKLLPLTSSRWREQLLAYSFQRAMQAVECPSVQLASCNIQMLLSLYTYDDLALTIVPWFLKSNAVMRKYIMSQLVTKLQAVRRDELSAKAASDALLAGGEEIVFCLASQQGLREILGEDLCEVLREGSDDGRLLIPTVPRMTCSAFLEKLPCFLAMGADVMRVLAMTILTHGKPLTPVEFLSEIAGRDPGTVEFAFDVRACVPAQVACEVLDRIARFGAPDCFCRLARKVIHLHRDTQRVVAKRVLGEFLGRDLQDEVWRDTLKLLNDLLPLSIVASFNIGTEARLREFLSGYEANLALTEFLAKNREFVVPDLVKSVVESLSQACDPVSGE